LTTNANVVDSTSDFPHIVPPIAVFTNWTGCDFVNDLETTGGTGAECGLAGPMTTDRTVTPTTNHEPPAPSHPLAPGDNDKGKEMP
jgi:hypothetical protein